jgi:hypothetical protein
MYGGHNDYVRREAGAASPLARANGRSNLAGMESIQEVTCPRCEKLNGPAYTVPLRLIPPGESAWQSLCGDCFRAVLNVKPSDDLVMRPVKRGRGRR